MLYSLPGWLKIINISLIKMVRARRYSWRKTATFFKIIGRGTLFDRLPLETLKIIFKYKIFAEVEMEKEERKIEREKLQEEQFLQCLYLRRF